MSETEPTRRIAVVGLGNVLMGDDGIGPAVIHRLESLYEIDSQVEVLDLGAPGPELAYLLERKGLVLLVDAISLDAPPSTLRWYSRDQLLAGKLPVRTTPHDPGLREALLKLDLLREGPAGVELLGVVPERVDLGTGLTEAAQRGVQAATLALLERLEREGIAWHERAGAELSPPWWERTGSH